MPKTKKQIVFQLKLIKNCTFIRQKRFPIPILEVVN